MREVLTSPRIEDMKRKRRIRRLRLYILVAFLTLSLIGALAYFSFNKHITINNIVVEGTHIINTKDIESNIKDNLSGRYIYLFSRANSFIYPHQQIYNDLLKSFPRIETLKISRDNLNTLKVTITERLGLYLYCGETVPEVKSEVGENCYFINSEGYIFDKAPYYSGNVYFKYYIALEDNSNPLGKHAFSDERFSLLTRFIDGVTALGFKPIYIVIDSDGTHSLYLASASLGITPKMTFRLEDDLSLILDNLATAMSKPEFALEVNSKYDTLLYIDLRFKNKVLYKFQ